MLTKTQLEYILSRCMQSNADFAEIFEEEGTSEAISMLNGDVENVNRILRAGLGIRLYKGVQSVYGYSNETDMKSVENLADSLRDAFGRKENDLSVELHQEHIENKHPIQINPIEASLQSKVDLMKRANDTAHDMDSRIVKVSTGLSSVEQHVQISNSNGKFVQDTRIRTRMSCSAYASENGNMQAGSDSPGASMGLEFYELENSTPEAIAKEAVRVALVMLQAKECPSGKMPVIIDNGFGGVIFHEACGHALEASAVSKNQSVFTNKLGQQIANPKVTAIDDGTIPNAWGSENVDDEGNPQQKRVLIKDGILQTYMIDTLNGRRMGMKSTGSSRRQSYKYETTSRMSNTYIAAGNDTFESMFEDIEKGLYAKKMGGGSVNPQTGEFNFSVIEGYIIRDGKICEPVKGASLIGNGKDILMNIDMVGKNLRRAQGMCGASSGSIPTDVGQPTIRVSNITVGGTSNE